MTDSNVGTPATLVEGNPQADPSIPVNGTSTHDGEAVQSATGQESFIPQGVDINTLPSNARAIIDKINKDMVRGFTEKTSKLSETIKAEAAKATEAYRSKAELYDQIAAQEEFVKQWNEYVQKYQSQPNPDNPKNPAEAELQQLKSQFQQMNEKIQMSEMQQITDAFAEAVNDKGEKLHPQFDEFNDIYIGNFKNGDQAEPFSLLRASIELAEGNTPQEKLVNGYKSAKAVYDAIFEKGKKSGMGRIQEKIMNSSQPPTRSTGETLSLTDKKPKSAAEALAMAKKGLVVSRE